jgi:hypothetical protein
MDNNVVSGEDNTKSNNGNATATNDTVTNNNVVDDENDNVHDVDDDVNNVKSCIIPPSHILSDGRYVHLPPPTINERSAYFERAVASHGLISIYDNNDGGDGGRKKTGRQNSKKRRRAAEDGEEVGKKDDDDNNGAARSSTPFVHPLAIASARLRAHGIDELSKAINLGGLVMGGEYFGLSNILAKTDRSAAGKPSPNGDDDETKKKETDSTIKTAKSSNNNGTIILDEITTIDQRLRSSYILDRRQLQYTTASSSLTRHCKRLVSSIAATRIVDDRLRSLRHRWTMAVPEHGTSVNAGPVRPSETVAVDVEVYNRRRDGLVGGGSSNAAATTMGSIAKRVPRYATLELNDEYDVVPDIVSLRTRIRNVIDSLSQQQRGDDRGTDDMEVDDNNNDDEYKKKKIPPPSSLGYNNAELVSCKTKAEPYAVAATPTLGRMDSNNNLDDPNKVPLLTLLFEIEKPSTGFVERATLSSNNNDGGDSSLDHHRTQPDEFVIESLQHSLFCASFFECIRAEIIPTSSTTHQQQSNSQQQQKHKSFAWLSSEMEESFLPPPSLMAGDNTNNSQQLCVIHCHEGEFKVQLDAEYSLTVKLIEAGTAAAIGTINDTVDSNKTSDTTTGSTVHDCSSSNNDGMNRISGSQSPTQLKTLCRTLLLHSQSIYHDHSMRANKEGRSIDPSTTRNEVPADVFFARKKSEKKYSSTPNILQNCVTLGCKIILEKKVRLVLKRLSQWLISDMKCSTTATDTSIDIEWLSLDVFCPYSKFVLLFRNLCLDVEIHGHALRVTSMTEDGYRSVGFSTDLELEYYLKLELRKALLSN